MDYSVYGYLERQPTDRLNCFLQACLSDAVWKDYAYIVPTVLEILAKRAEAIPEDL